MLGSTGCQPVAFGRRAECDLGKAQNKMRPPAGANGIGSRQAAANYRPAACAPPDRENILPRRCKNVVTVTKLRSSRAAQGNGPTKNRLRLAAYFVQRPHENHENILVRCGQKTIAAMTTEANAVIKTAPAATSLASRTSG